MKKIYILLLSIFMTATIFGQAAGDVIITEIMQNPNAVNDSSGEWFEIYNTTGSDIDLNGWTITDNGTNAHTISGSLIIPANGYLVLGNNDDTSTNGNIPVDYSYGSDVALANGSDAIILTTGGGLEIDRVEWDNGATFPDPIGKSMNLDPNSYDATANDDGSNWCEATTALGTQFGTPGADNTSCAAPCDLVLGDINAVCDAFTTGTDTYTATLDFTGGGTSTYVINVSGGTISGDDPSTQASGTITVTGVNEGSDLTIDIDNSGVGGSCNFTITVTAPVCIPATCDAVGSVIFTEIMQNPTSPVNDAEGEWFELYNTTNAPIDLLGWSIVDDSHTLYQEGFVFESSVVIPAGGYVLIANNSNSSLNGGLPTPDYVYDYVASNLTLGNGTDGITLQCPQGTIIDSVVWDNGATFPDPDGKSMSLDPNSYDATANDDGANWCEATTAFGAQFGTPGAANTSCATPCELVLGNTSAICDDTTSGTDTYTATLEFTGGGTSTYTINVNSGTISGDDPSTQASGTITVTGVDEGTDLTIDIDNLDAGGSCDLSVTITSPICVPVTCDVVGSVIFTEIMQNPASPVNDSEGEWFELYNTTNAPIDLQGWSIIDDNHTLEQEGFVFETSVVIPAGGYVLIANNGDSSLNGGLPTPDYVYDYVASNLTLGNGTDGITLQCPQGTVIDSVIWDDGATFPDPSGKSMSLNDNALNATDNDNGANWSEATASYGNDGQFGTPGTANNPNSINHNEIEGFSVYPNPVNDGNILIKTTGSSTKEVNIYNVLGEIVYSTTFTGTQTTINLKNMHTGIYVIKVQEGTKVSTGKLVVK